MVARLLAGVILAICISGVASAQTTQPTPFQEPQPISEPSVAARVPASAVNATTTTPAAAVAGATTGATTQQPPLATPSTRPINRSAEEMLRQMLQPQAQAAQPLQPLLDLPNPQTYDLTSGPNAVMPGATTQPLTSEGTLVFDQIGRLTPSDDGKTFEFTFDSDGPQLTQPPLVLSPNKSLELLEQYVASSNGDVRVHVSGEIMEYKGRNYLLLSKWAPLPDVAKPLQ
jgi:hypothetical protein